MTSREWNEKIDTEIQEKLDSAWLEALLDELFEEENWDCAQGHLADRSCCKIRNNITP
jgi:hypothetical protein